MGQFLKYNRFARFNEGLYGTYPGETIPLDQSQVPTALFIARHDQIATVKDNENLSK